MSWWLTSVSNNFSTKNTPHITIKTAKLPIAGSMLSNAKYNDSVAWLDVVWFVVSIKWELVVWESSRMSKK